MFTKLGDVLDGHMKAWKWEWYYDIHFHSHTIDKWYIYLHLVDFYGQRR